jgi:hypothetical protein
MSGSVLRPALLVVGGILVTGGALAARATCSVASFAAIGWGIVLLVGLAIERWRYKTLADRPPGPDWIATDERFIDPESGRPVTVYQNPATGERRYIAA